MNGGKFLRAGGTSSASMPARTLAEASSRWPTTSLASPLSIRAIKHYLGVQMLGVIRVWLNALAYSPLKTQGSHAQAGSSERGQSDFTALWLLVKLQRCQSYLIGDC